MLDDKSLIVLTYLKNHFKSNDTPLDADKIHINGMSILDIEEAFHNLEANGKVELIEGYIHPIVENVID